MMNPTNKQIRALRSEAEAAGDTAMVYTCTVALGEASDDQDETEVARACELCAEAIESARAMESAS